MLIVGAVGFVVVRRSATAGAIRQARELSELAGRGIVEPLITPAVLLSDPAALARLDGVVRQTPVRELSHRRFYARPCDARAARA